ncbi:MAG: hypothetical protein U1D00_35330 [Mycobacterium sp.]|nr:hypothetical protein [Mycobacterium sp.]
MDMVPATHLVASSATPTSPGWVGYLVFAIAGGIGFAGYGLFKKDRSFSNFVKDFAWGAVGMLLVTFVLSYFFQVRPPWIDS